MNATPATAALNPRRWPPLGWAIGALLVAWILAGALPFSPVEGDEMGVINGLHAREQGMPSWRSESYLYSVQPGSYWLILAITRALHTELFTAFALGSALATVAFAVTAAIFLSRTVETEFSWTFVATVLFAQEIAAAAAYANTSTFAGTFVLAGVIFFNDGAARSRALVAGGLIGIGGWLRLDALLIAPAVAVLAVLDAKRLANVAIATAATLVFLFGAFFVSGVPLAEVWTTYTARTTELGYPALVRSFPFLLSYSGIAVGLIGVILLFHRRAWRLLLLVAIGVLPSLVVHGRVMTTTKYLYYTVPFLLVPTIVAAQWAVALARSARPHRMLPLTTLSLLVAAEWIFAIRTTPEEIRVAPVSPAVKLMVWHARGHDNAVVVGSGDAFSNDDGLRLRGGLLFAPLVWRQAKAGVLASRESISSILRSRADVLIIVSSMNAFHCAKDLLWTADFQPNPLQRYDPGAYGGIQRWDKPGRRCEVALFVHDMHAPTLLARFLDLAYAHETAVLLNDRGPILARDLWPAHARWPRPARTPLGFMNLFERP